MPEQSSGPFISALGWMDDLGQVPLNVLRGRFKSAGKKAVDILGDIPDAILPGDWIPHLSDEEDATSGSEVLGIDKKNHPILGAIADIAVGTAANPLTYLGLRGGKVMAGVPFTEGVELKGATALKDAAKKKVGELYDKAPEPLRKGVKKSYDASAKMVRRTANWLDIPDAERAAMVGAKSIGATSAMLHAKNVERIFGPLSKEERDIAGQVLHGIEKLGVDRKDWREITDPDAFLLSKLPKERVAKVRAAIDESYDHATKQFEEGMRGGVYKPMQKDAQGNVLPGQVAGQKNYAHRMFTDESIDPSTITDYDLKTALPTAAHKAKLKTAKDRIAFLQDNKDINLEFDPLVSGLSRAKQQGDMLTKGALGKKYSGIDDFVLNDPKHRSAMEKAIADMGDSDQAYQLGNFWRGIPARGDDAFSQVLHKGNKIFKAAATFGVLVPRMSFNVGNRASGVWQALSNEQARGVIGENSKRLLSDLMGAVDDGLVKLTGSRHFPVSEMTKDLDHWEEALKLSKGDPLDLKKRLADRPDLLEAVENGVLKAGWVDQEQLLSRMAATPTRQRVNDFMEWPAEIAQGIEQRMRYGTFKDLIKSKKGITPADAAKTVDDTFLNYDVPGLANRRFRDIVPFGAFLSQNVRQQAGFVARHPVVGVAAANFYGSDPENIRYPWMDESMSVPAGLDEQGNPQYVTSLRMPIEGLAAVPGNLYSEDAYHDVVGALQPLLKTAFHGMTGKDSFTGGPAGQYDKILGQSAGEAGRAYNTLRGTGLIQPLSGPMDQLTNLIDSRKSIGERALQATTGVRFQSVDPDKAKQLEIEQYLKANPDVKQYTGYFQEQGNQDPGLQELLQQLREAKAKLKEKREAAAITPL